MKKRFLLAFGLMILLALALAVTVSAEDDGTGALAEITEVRAGRVTASTLNLRKSPSQNGAWMKTLAQGDIIIIHGQEGEWYNASHDGKTGYVFAEYVEPIANMERSFGKATVTGTFVYIRSAPNTDSSVQGTLSEGVLASITGVQDGWFAVSYGSGKNQIKGYMHPDFLSPIEEAKPVTSSKSTAATKIVSEGTRIIQTARKYIGTRYVLGGNTPSQGFDCSGLVVYVYKQFGYTFKQRTRLYLDGKDVKYGNLMIGDLVFFDTNGNGGIGHVGIYSGNGNFIHAPSPGKSVREETMTKGYYRTRFVCARRVIG